MNYQKLREYICSNSEKQKKDLMELREGCEFTIGDKKSKVYSKYDALLDRSPTTPYNEKSIWNIQHSIGNNYQLCVFHKQKTGDYQYKVLNTTDIFKILGNPLELRHILQILGKHGTFCIAHTGVLFKSLNGGEKPITTIDLTKPFHRQEDSVYEEILDYLTKQ